MVIRFIDLARAAVESGVHPDRHRRSVHSAHPAAHRRGLRRGSHRGYPRPVEAARLGVFRLAAGAGRCALSSRSSTAFSASRGRCCFSSARSRSASTRASMCSTTTAASGSDASLQSMSGPSSSRCSNPPSGLGVRDTRIRIWNEPLMFGVGPGMLGRTFDSIGQPTDAALRCRRFAGCASMDSRSTRRCAPCRAISSRPGCRPST